MTAYKKNIKCYHQVSLLSLIVHPPFIDSWSAASITLVTLLCISTLSPCKQVSLRCAVHLQWIEYQENGSSDALRMRHLTVLCPLQNNSEKQAPCDPNNSRFILGDRKNEWWIVFDRSKHLQGRCSIYTAFINASVLTWNIFPFITLENSPPCWRIAACLPL